MKKCLLLLVIAFALAFSISWTAAAAAEQQTLAEKLLQILKTNHQITQEQYDELLKEAQKEKAAQKAAVARQVEAQTAEVTKESKRKNPSEIKVSWKKHEIYFESNDKNFTGHIGGYAQIDFADVFANRQLKLLDTVNSRGTATKAIEGYGAEARRARLTAEGTLYSDIGYKAQLEFAGGKATITDLFITLQDIPCIGNMRVGHMKEPFSLEALTASNWYPFMERSPGFTFASGNPTGTRNVGVQFFNQEFGKRMTWALGGFVQQNNSSGTSFQDFDNTNITGRVTALPWYEDNGCQLVHLGFGFRHLFRSSNPDYADLVFKSNPEIHVPGINVVNTGVMASDDATIINPEAAFVYGPFSVQGEYFHAFVDHATVFKTVDSTTAVKSLGNPEFDAYYVFATYFLTGEHRNYDRNYGIFGRPIPYHNFSLTQGGWGAWQLAFRYAGIDLNDFLVTGGKEDDITAGINWYLNPNIRWTLNYVHSHVYDRPAGAKIIRDGNANIVGTRFQFAF